MHLSLSWQLVSNHKGAAIQTCMLLSTRSFHALATSLQDGL